MVAPPGRDPCKSAFKPFQPLEPSADLSNILSENFTSHLIEKKTQIIPYQEILAEFSSEQIENIEANIEQLLSDLALDSPSLKDIFCLAVRKNAIIEAGRNLQGFPVLKMLEMIAQNKLLKKKIQTIFCYPAKAADINFAWHPVDFALAKIRENFFGGLQQYLQTNLAETMAQLEDFTAAIKKEKDYSYFKAAIALGEWDEFFKLAIYPNS